MKNVSKDQAQFSDADVQRAVLESNVPVVNVTAPQQSNPATLQQAISAIAHLAEEQLDDPSSIMLKINECIDAINALTQRSSSAPVAVRNRGPVSEKQMTEDDARKIMLGDYKDASHKKCAEDLGLSYGQVYSARKGFTFKKIVQEAKAAGKTW